MLYAHALNESMAGGEAMPVAENVTKRMWNRTFYGELCCFTVCSTPLMLCDFQQCVRLCPRDLCCSFLLGCLLLLLLCFGVACHSVVWWYCLQLWIEAHRLSVSSVFSVVNYVVLFWMLSRNDLMFKPELERSRLRGQKSFQDFVQLMFQAWSFFNKFFTSPFSTAQMHHLGFPNVKK